MKSVQTAILVTMAGLCSAPVNAQSNIDELIEQTGIEDADDAHSRWAIDPHQ